MTTAVIYLLLRSLTTSAEFITFTAFISLHLVGMTEGKSCWWDQTTVFNEHHTVYPSWRVSMGLVKVSLQTSSKAPVGLIWTSEKLVSEPRLSLCACPIQFSYCKCCISTYVSLKESRAVFYDKAFFLFLSFFLFFLTLLPFCLDRLTMYWLQVVHTGPQKTTTSDLFNQHID